MTPLRTMTASLAIAAACQPAVAEARDPRLGAGTLYVDPGFLFSYGFREVEGPAFGVEVSLPYLFADSITSAGPLVQYQAGPGVHRTMVGIEVSAVLGAELGYALRVEEGEPAHGLHTALFLSAVALNVGPRVVFWRDGIEASLTLSAKFPFRVSGPGLNIGHGRPVRRASHGRLALRLTRARCPAVHMPERARVALAGAWLEHALDEQASVATFCVLARDLASLGAPRALVQRARAAAREERAHARRCLRVFAALTGLAVEAQVDVEPPPPPSLAELAYESHHDGVLGEGQGAHRLLEVAGAAQGEVRDHLGAMAREEHGHGALAHDVLAWAVKKGGRPVQRALERARTAEAPPVLADGRSRLGAHWGKPQLAL